MSGRGGRGGDRGGRGGGGYRGGRGGGGDRGGRGGYSDRGRGGGGGYSDRGRGGGGGRGGGDRGGRGGGRGGGGGFAPRAIQDPNDKIFRSNLQSGMRQHGSAINSAVQAALTKPGRPSVGVPKAPSGPSKCMVPLGKLVPGMKVISNIYRMKVQEACVYQNAVHFSECYSDNMEKLTEIDLNSTSDIPFNRMVMEAVSEKEKDFPLFVYDGRSTLYSLAKLPAEGVTTVVDHPNKRPGVCFLKIQINPTGKYMSFPLKMDSPLEPSEDSSAMDVIMRAPMLELARRNKWIVSNATLLSPEWTDQRHIGGGYFALYGITSTVRICLAGECINVDAVVAASPKPGPVMDYLQRATNCRSLDELARGLADGRSPVFRMADESIKGIQFGTEHLGYSRKYKAKGLSTKSAADHTFDWEQPNGETKKISTAQYFKEVYKVVLKQSRLPCIVVGSKAKPILIPIEMCSIPQGQVRRALNPDQTASVLVHAAVPAAMRYQRIADNVKLLADEVNKNNAMCKKLGLTIAPAPVVCEKSAGILPSPTLQFGGNRGNMVEPGLEGRWQMRGAKYLRPASCMTWGVICLDRGVDEPTVRRLGDLLMNTMVDKGMRANRPHHVQMFFNNTDQTLTEAVKPFKTKPDLFFVIIKPGDYGAVKLFETKFKVQTACIQPKNAKKATGDRGDQMLGNLVLKINAKLSGTSHVVGNKGGANVTRPWVLGNRTMLLGIDVTHPTGMSGGSTSVASIVGSVDNCQSVYASHIFCPQRETQEILNTEGVTDAVDKLLKEFHRRNKCMPNKFIIFRDGVSEGQFQQILDCELKFFKQALESNGLTGKDAQVTVVSLQKRHKVRLFLQDKQGVIANTIPGVVVDGDITRPGMDNFFLNSHVALQGTAKSTHVAVLHDEIGISSETMRLLAYYECYAFQRSTTSISHAASARLAHLAAFRGQVLRSAGASASDIKNLGPGLNPLFFL